ncbi:hypothetical protein NPIL_673891, partial [Nephila pilipes]
KVNSNSTKNQRPLENYRQATPGISYSQILTGQVTEHVAPIPNSAASPSTGNFGEIFRSPLPLPYPTIGLDTPTTGEKEQPPSAPKARTIVREKALASLDDLNCRRKRFFVCFASSAFTIPNANQ